MSTEDAEWLDEVFRCAIEYTNEPPKPEDAPHWARWMAQDEDGEWCWFRHKPVYDKSFIGLGGAWTVDEDYDTGDGDNEGTEWMQTGIFTLPSQHAETMLIELKQ